MPVLPLPEAPQAFGRQAAGPGAPPAGAAASRTIASAGEAAHVPAPAELADALREMQSQAPALEFVLDGERAIVRVVDRETGEVLRQIPAEEAIAASRALARLQGLLIRLKA